MPTSEFYDYVIVIGYRINQLNEASKHKDEIQGRLIIRGAIR